MKEFNYIIFGGGCAGLSLAYELNNSGKLKDKSLAIIETRKEYKRDKTWSFWKIRDHNFEDCVIKSWDNFIVSTKGKSCKISNDQFKYQTINSDLFYKKIINQISKNKNIQFLQNINEVNTENSVIFNSVNDHQYDPSNFWQHFKGIEIETNGDVFDEKVLTLMDFDCQQRNNLHFFYILPFEKNRALIETTWISTLDDPSLKDYDQQLRDYIKNKLNIMSYKINFVEEGAIPLSRFQEDPNDNTINIGSLGNMTRLSTGYTFLNIQEHSKFIANNLGNVKSLKTFAIPKKYDFLDKIFLKVLKNYPEKMPDIFFNFFNKTSKSSIKFLSNKSNMFDDLLIILKMPKWIFIKSLFR